MNQQHRYTSARSIPNDTRRGNLREIKTGNTGGRLSKQPEGGMLSKVKILVATLLVASPAFAADNGGVFTLETGFLQDTSLDGAGFHIDVGGFIGDNDD
jgi:hypothetical protein